MYFPSFNFWRNAGTAVLAGSPVVKKSMGNTGDLYIVNTPTTYTQKTVQVGRPDLVFKRSAVLAALGGEPKDGLLPGPIINGNKGDTFSITVHNNLDDKSMYTETTIHWHGIEMHHTYWADGVAFVTQCPIIPDDKFTYTFPVPNQAGTFWYHSHYLSQYCDGLRGALIIRDDQDPYLKNKDYDADGDNDDTVISLIDWYSEKEAKGDSKWKLHLINGHVRSRIEVKPNKKYRFRLINMGCHDEYTFSIDDHMLTVIEADGVLTQKYDVTHIPIHAGQRYSFILDTAKTVDNYWIRAERITNKKDFGGLAILHYAGADKAKKPTTKRRGSGSVRLLNEAEIKPYDERPAPGSKSRTADVPDCKDLTKEDLISMREATDDLPVCNQDVRLNYKDDVGFTINDVHFKSPSEAVLLQILSGKVKPYDVLPESSVIPLPRDVNVQVTFYDDEDMTGGMHPMHLHGHTFSVVQSAEQEDYNWDNPPRRDTVATTPKRTNKPRKVTIRFKTDNPGPWMLHCHMDHHLVEGLAMVFAEDTRGAKELEDKIPGGKEKIAENCAKYDAWVLGKNVKKA